jgi:hypothetical protein
METSSLIIVASVAGVCLLITFWRRRKKRNKVYTAGPDKYHRYNSGYSESPVFKKNRYDPQPSTDQDIDTYRKTVLGGTDFYDWPSNHIQDNDTTSRSFDRDESPSFGGGAFGGGGAGDSYDSGSSDSGSSYDSGSSDSSTSND